MSVKGKAKQKEGTDSILLPKKKTHNKTQSNPNWFLLSERLTVGRSYPTLPMFWGRHRKEKDTCLPGAGALNLKTRSG